MLLLLEKHFSLLRKKKKKIKLMLQNSQVYNLKLVGQEDCLFWQVAKQQRGFHVRALKLSNWQQASELHF